MSLYELWGYGLVRVIYCPIRDDAVTACPLDIYHIKVVNSLKQIVIEEAVLEESREEGGGASKARRREGEKARSRARGWLLHWSWEGRNRTRQRNRTPARLGDFQLRASLLFKYMLATCVH